MDDAEKFVLDRLKDVLLTPQHLNQIVDEKKQKIRRLLDAEGYRITREDVVKVIELANDTVADSDIKADTKAVLRTFIDKIIFNKETKSNYKIHMTFTQDVIDILNEKAHKKPTAEKNAVGFSHSKNILKMYIQFKKFCISNQNYGTVNSSF